MPLGEIPICVRRRGMVVLERTKSAPSTASANEAIQRRLVSPLRFEIKGKELARICFQGENAEAVCVPTLCPSCDQEFNSTGETLMCRWLFPENQRDCPIF